MNIKKKLLLCLISVLAGGAFAHEIAQVQQAATAPSLAARFELKINKTKTGWYLWREVDSVETADLLSGQNQIWERSGQADYSYQRVFNDEQRIVEYTPGEIRTRNAEPDWSKLSSIVSPQMLTALKRGPSKTLFGQEAVQYSGVIDGQTVKLWWLTKAQLPAQLAIYGNERSNTRNNAQNLEMTLRELHAQAPASWPRASESRISAYARMDAADFGDMENDPFVARVMQMDGHSHAH